MLSVTVAAVVATVLCLLIRSLRPLGAVGTFVLVALNPIIFGGLVLLTGLVYLLLFRRSDYELIPKVRMLPPDEACRRRRALGLLLLAGGAAGVIALVYAPPAGDTGSYVATMGETRSAPREEVIVLRTAGGLLEVSRIDAVEVLDARITHSLLGVEIGETAPRIRARAIYRYSVRLDPEWRVLRKHGVFTVVAPAVRPTLPVAIDTASIEKDVAGTWLLVQITGDEDLEALERTITAKLAQKASSRDYVERQRENARSTLEEFVTGYLINQTRFADARADMVRVLFADEPVRSIEALWG